MSLFHFGKRTKEKATVCCCQKAETAQTVSCCKDTNSSCQIQVLGSGCKNCHTLLENTKTAVQTMGLTANIEFITDLQKIAAYGIMSTPALVVSGEVVSTGKVLKPAAIETLLRNHGF